MSTPDVIVVGSSFGGAVTAARLSQRGLRVLILERGPCGGRRAATSQRAYFGRVRALLRPAPPYPEKNVAFAHATATAGLGAPRYPGLAIRFGRSPTVREPGLNAAGVLQSTCTHCGCCVLGGPERAKTTLDLPDVPLALRHGAELRPLCELVAIGQRDGRYRVRYRDHRSARSSVGELVVGTFSAPPFVMRDPDGIWQDIARAYPGPASGQGSGPDQRSRAMMARSSAFILSRMRDPLPRWRTEGGPPSEKNSS
jgi:putative NAD(P)-binding protein